MKTILVNVPDKDSNLFTSLLARLGFVSHEMSKEDIEDMATAKWIDAGMQSEEVSEETINKTLRKNGVKI